MTIFFVLGLLQHKLIFFRLTPMPMVRWKFCVWCTSWILHKGLILWGDLCNKKFLHTSFHGLKVRQMFAVCMFSCAFGGFFLPKKNLWRIYSLTKIHYKHELFCTCVRNSDLLSQDIYTRVLLLMYAKKILQFLTNSGIIAWGWICVPSCHRRRNTLRRKWFAAQLRRFLSSKIRCSVDHPRRFSS